MDTRVIPVAGVVFGSVLIHELVAGTDDERGVALWLTLTYSGGLRGRGVNGEQLR